MRKNHRWINDTQDKIDIIYNDRQKQIEVSESHYILYW